MNDFKNSDHIVETRGLIKFFGKKSVVHKLNLKVPCGGIFGFLGPNGAGKSTTIKMILGLLRPTSGSIKVFGMKLQEHRQKILQRVGYLPENPILYEKMRVIDYIRYMARLHKVRGDLRKKSLEILDFFGIARQSFSQCRELSAGQRQRVGLAQAFVHDPEFVILDEPTTNLDPLGRLQVFEKLRQLVEEKEKTIFISSHILPEIERLCDHLGILSEGKLVAAGSMASFVAHATDKEYVIIVDRPTELYHDLRPLPNIIDLEEKEFQIVVQVKPHQEHQFKKQLLEIILEKNYQLKAFKPLYTPIEKTFIDALGIRSKRDLENVNE